MPINYGNITEECEQIKRRIKKAKLLGKHLLAFELQQELDFLERNFPTECGEKDERARRDHDAHKKP